MDIYLDNAATTRPDPRVVEEIQQVVLEVWGNPSSVHSKGQQARSLVEKSRRIIADCLSCDPHEIYFNSGATEAIGTILWGCVMNGGLKHIISSRLEHSATLRNLESIEKRGFARISWVDFNQNGTPSLIHLEQLLNTNAERTLVVLMHGNNETGSLSPVDEIGRICKRHKAWFFSDTVQTMGKYPIHPSRFNIDFLVCSAHKLHGPKGAGFMYIRKGLIISPLLVGGGQERNMRSGTENLCGIAGLAKAMEIACHDYDTSLAQLDNLKKLLLAELSSRINGICFFAESDRCGMEHIVSAGIPKTAENELLHVKLDMKGIAISAGSACSSGVVSVPHALKEMGVTDDYIPLRISTGRFTTPEEILHFVNILQQLV